MKSQIINRLLGYTIILSFALVLNSCQSNSKSGRSEMIATAMAKKEAKKRSTTPTPKTIKKNVIPKIIEIEDVVTPKENEAISNKLIKKNIPKAEGKLIQIEGLVLKEVSELTILLGIPNNQIRQIFTLKEHVRGNWHYIFDPKANHDTWRSAEATISLKYKGKYPGDCDDYAILMASFARQIGLESRMVAGLDDSGAGHAFAEFLLPENLANHSLLRGKDYRTDYKGKWYSLDWFNGADHRKYKNNVKVFDNI